MVIPALGIRHHPIDVAIEIATQALLHPGRVALCVGTGEAMNEKTTTGFWPSLRERIDRCIGDRADQDLGKRRLLSPQGKHFKSFFYLYTKPGRADSTALRCAGLGHGAERGSLYCDGYVAVGVPSAHHHDVLIPAFEEGGRAAGKNPSRLMKCAWVSTSYYPDPEQALNGARVYGGLLIPEAYNHIQDPRVIEQRALLVRDESLRDAFCIASSAAEVAETFERLIDAGYNDIIWADMSPDPTLVAPSGLTGDAASSCERAGRFLIALITVHAYFSCDKSC